MNKLTANFIWGGQSEKRKFHLSKLSDISLPKSLGGWGLLDLQTFEKALLCKSLWRGIYGEGPWSSTIQKKYMGSKDISHWFRLGRIGSTYGEILIGIDHFLSGVEEIIVPKTLIKFFHRKGFFFWDKLISDWQGSIPLWKEAENMEMPDSIARKWENIRTCLRNYDIYRSSESDCLIWKDSKGINLVRVKDIYQNMIGLKGALLSPIFPIVFWKSGCPSKMVYFSWFTFHNKNLSWENLKKRGWHGTSICLICKSAEESNCHMFLNFQRTQQLWQSLENIYGIPHISHASTKEAFLGGVGRRIPGGR
eukprot:PITA_10699